MSAFGDLLHDIVSRLRVFTEQESKDLHDKVEAAVDEIKSWVSPPGVKTVEDTQSVSPVHSSGAEVITDSASVDE